MPKVMNIALIMLVAVALTAVLATVAQVPAAFDQLPIAGLRVKG
jgi:hypothetical protein